ncbi:polyprenyl synthetase family protein, partial [Streptomyces sp. SID7499]|nr:polyprenyl synthetase family protein [Streptomyces sp. SID7499]
MLVTASPGSELLDRIAARDPLFRDRMAQRMQAVEKRLTDVAADSPDPR